MKKSILISLISLMMASLNAATYRVTPKADGGGDGQSWDSPMTIAEAIAAAKADDIILCKAGTYTPTATIAISTPMTVKGGLAGTDDETLAENGERSVFDTQNDTTINNIFSVTTASGLNTFEGIEVHNAYFRGFNKSKAGSLSFKNCVFDSCGKKYKTDTTLRGSAGCFLGDSKNISATIAFENCIFSCNSYEASNGINVGNGIALAFQSCKRVMIDNCLFVSNGLGRAALKSSTPPGANIKGVRGAAIYAENPLTVRNTEFRANTTGIHTGNAGAMGGVVYIKLSSGLSSFTNCLFLANSCEQCNTYGSKDTEQEAGVLVVRSGKNGLDVVNCTFAYNFTDGEKTSAGIDVGANGTKYTTANIKNTIFYGAKKSHNSEKGRDIWVSGGCSANIDYCLFDSDGGENIEKCIAGAGTITIGSNNVFGDPKFTRAIPAEEIDSIMVNNGTYYGYSADAYENVFSKADVHAKNRKLTVDTGDPASPYSNEPTPNGKRVNLGYYGNTPEARSTVVGMRVIIR